MSLDRAYIALRLRDVKEGRRQGRLITLREVAAWNAVYAEARRLLIEEMQAQFDEDDRAAEKERHEAAHA